MSDPNRDRTFRCVLCFGLIDWKDGASDHVEVVVTQAVNQAVFVDNGLCRRDRKHRRLRRRLARRGTARPPVVSDGGTCSDCWVALGGEKIVAVPVRTARAA